MTSIATTNLPAHSSDPTLRCYLAQIRSIPRVDDATAAQLARRYQEDGDLEAGRELVQHHLYLVVQVAMRYQRRWCDMLDLIQEGNVGLMRAIDKFDPTREVPFTAYARYWIRAMLLRYMQENLQLVTVGHTRAARRLFFELGRRRAGLMQQGLAATPAELAREWDLPQEEVARTLVVFQREESLTPDPELRTRQLPAGWGNPEAEVERHEHIALLQAALDEFEPTLRNDKEVALWSDRLLAEEPVTLADLGRRFGVSRERMRQLEKKLKSRLQEFLAGVLEPEALAA